MEVTSGPSGSKNPLRRPVHRHMPPQTRPGKARCNRRFRSGRDDAAGGVGLQPDAVHEGSGFALLIAQRGSLIPGGQARRASGSRKDG